MLEPKQINSLSEDNQAVLRALTQAILLSSGFNLLFAKCNFALQRDELIQLIRRQIPDIFLVELNEPQEDLHAYIESALPAHQDCPLFILGYERSIVYQSSNRNSLQVLNTARENLKKLHSGPIVFWLPDYALTELAKFAPDLWAWRSGVYEFNSEINYLDSQVSLEKYWPYLDDSFATLRADERWFQIKELKQQIYDYENSESRTKSALPHLEAGLYFRLARLEKSLSLDSQVVEKHFLKALEQFNSIEDLDSIIRCYQELGMLMLNQNLIEQAEDYFQIGFKLVRQQSNLAPIGHFLYHLALVKVSAKRYQEAWDYIEQARNIYLHLNNDLLTGIMTLEAGRIAMFQNQWELSYNLLLEAKQTLQKSGHQRGVASALYRLGWLMQEQNNPNEALRFFKSSLEISQQLADSHDISLALHQIGVQFFRLGLQIEAQNAFSDALKTASLVSKEWESQLSESQINFYEALNKIEEH